MVEDVTYPRVRLIPGQKHRFARSRYPDLAQAVDLQFAFQQVKDFILIEVDVGRWFVPGSRSVLHKAEAVLGFGRLHQQ